MSSAVLTCALTGPIATRADNPNLPTTPEEIAASARGAHQAGAAVAHVYETGHLAVARQLVAEDPVEEPLAFSIVMGVHGGMPATPAALVELVQRLPDGAVRQAIALGRANRTMTAIGLAMSGNARTGMEDTLVLRRGAPAQSNAELVARLADVAEVEQLLALPPGRVHAG